MEKHYTCIACPMGCSLTLTQTGDSITVTGNKCKRGITYATEEFTAPKRMVTATMKSNSTLLPRIPVKTSKALPKELIDELLTAIYQTPIHVPVHCGDVLIQNFKGTSVDVVAARSMEQ